MMRWLLLCMVMGSGCMPSRGREAGVEGDDAVDAAVDEIQETQETQETQEISEPEEVAQAVACIRVLPGGLYFNADQTGIQSAQIQVESCGDAPLVISEIMLSDDGDGQYEVFIGREPGTVAPNSVKSIIVRFVPRNDDALPPEGELTIRSNAPHGDVVVPITAFGHGQDCPIAVIAVHEGDEVAPQTNLHLDGTGSIGVGSEIVAYEWTVLQPNGSVSSFLPSNTVSQPTFEANIVGPYIFRLNVVDAFGNRSCVPDELTVVVAESEAVTIVMSWVTAGDPDASEAPAGSNVDLHFLHPLAAGDYFGAYDCHVGNDHPEWGIFSPSDNPLLVHGDDVSSNPESLHLGIPEQGARYQVSAHYADDADWGPARVTIHIYVYGVLRDLWTADLAEHDMWRSHFIDWPSGDVTRIGDGETPDLETVLPPR